MRPSSKNKINYKINILNSPWTLRVRSYISVYKDLSKHLRHSKKEPNFVVYGYANKKSSPLTTMLLSNLHLPLPLPPPPSLPSTYNHTSPRFPPPIPFSFSSSPNFIIAFVSKRKLQIWSHQVLISPKDIVPPGITKLEKARKVGSLPGDRLQTWVPPSHKGAVTIVPH